MWLVGRGAHVVFFICFVKKAGFCTIEAMALGQDRLTYFAAVLTLGLGFVARRHRTQPPSQAWVGFGLGAGSPRFFFVAELGRRGIELRRHQSPTGGGVRAGSIKKQTNPKNRDATANTKAVPPGSSAAPYSPPLPHIHIPPTKLPGSRYTSAARLLERACTYNNAWCLHSPVTAHKHAPVTKKRQQESLLLSLSLSLSSYLIMLAKPTELLRRLLSFAVYRASSKHKDVVYKTLCSVCCGQCTVPIDQSHSAYRSGILRALVRKVYQKAVKEPINGSLWSMKAGSGKA